ncbi:pilus assembly protein [Noviherbaspirillum saxi]|uniref:PilY1 beta-propeller domain-containing protein n=1 Tax=Noviherbaspirillum saxi TaxID=2320863 RepID=A0A3A3FRW4_9BURK|nr:PilC/PilY family type IV pilus protein [Noviherbaspirillum saxi]RJF98937.1 hypothetical protein D3871_10750 [Noviherbaspirillum saxi]
MDGTVTVAEAHAVGGWKTVLLASMGGGAQGVFALDVSDPASFAGGGRALFEFGDADDPDMGYVIGTPAIAKFRAYAKEGAPDYRYFAVVSSGMNNYKNDGAGRFNQDASGALFLLSLDKPPSAKWQLGVNYYKYRTPSKDAGVQNGLSAPALVTGADGAVRYAYAGDMQGNLWRFDFTGAAPWNDALAGTTPLFMATDDKGKRQPLTTQPRVAFAPGGGYVVLIGTGKFIEEDDAAKGKFSTQSFYGVLDAMKSDYAASGRADLASRSLEKVNGAFKITGAELSYDANITGAKGWYFDFPDSATGERSVTNPMLINGLLFFNTLIPGSDPCDAGGGRSYVVDTLSGMPANGGVTGHLSAVGMLSAPVPFETGTEVGERNAIGRRAVKKKYSVVNFGTGAKTASGTGVAAGGAAVGEKIEIKPPAGRFSWREIPNWQELRNAKTSK